MNQNLAVLGKYFAGGSAEEEVEILNQIFVRNNSFESIIMPPSRTVRLLVGSKGSGKSAVLQYWNNICGKFQIPCILLTPTLVDVESSDGQSTRQYTQNIYRALIKEIGIKVGTELSGLLSDAQKRLVEDAIRAGVREPTAMDRLLSVLKPVGKTITSINFNEMIPYVSNDVRGSVNVLNNYFQSEGKILYLLFDDIDQFGNAGSSSYLDQIWSAVLAFRLVVQQLPNIRAIVTLRNEIWRQINNRGGNGRDQVDHVRSWIINLVPTEADMSKILRTRLEKCRSIVQSEYKERYTNAFQPFFEGDRCKLPSSTETRKWETYILKSSRDRPRDSVQLIDLMVKDANRCDDNKICDRNVENTAIDYSEQRVQDLCGENVDLCPEIEAVIASFASIKSPSKRTFELEANVIKQHLLRLPGIGIHIQGSALQPENIDDMFRLWGLLFQLGFINARMADIQGQDGYRHIGFHDDPTLVSRERWNDMQAVRWEIHPCYRSYLLKKAEMKNSMLFQKQREKDNNTLQQRDAIKNNGKKKRRRGDGR